MIRQSNDFAAAPNAHRKISRWLPFALAAFAFVLYASNASSTVTYGGDSGELIAAAHRLGIAHPTGYVFYTLLGRTFESVFALGEIAWRYNIFSALCGAACIGVLTQLMCEVFRTSHLVLDWPSLYAAGGASAMLAGFYFFFGQSVLAEVYSLSALMLSLLLWCAWRWHDSVLKADDLANSDTSSTRIRASPDWRWLWTLGFVFGLSLNAHMSCVFLLPALVLWCLWHHRAVFKNRVVARLATLTFFTFCGFALTLYLPLRSGLFPTPINGQWWPLDWTHPVDFSSWYSHLRAKQYEFLFLQPKQVEFLGNTTTMKWFVQPFAAIPAKISALMTLLLMQWLWCLFLIPIGAWVAWKRNRALGGALLWVFAVNFAVQINYDVGVGELANFLFPAYIAMTLWMGFGLRAMFSTLQRWSVARWSVERDQIATSSTRTNARSGAWQWRVRTISLLLLVATSAVQLTLSTPIATTRGNIKAREAALERARSVEMMSRSKRRVQLWMNSDDAMWSFWYAQFVLRRAPNVQTPWGQPWRKTVRQQGALALATSAMRDGELAMSYYDDVIDAKFPLVPLNEVNAPRGLVWRASRRQLPMAARPIANIEYSMSDVNKDANKIKARFPAIATKNGIAHLKREDMTRLQLDFQAPWTNAIANSPLESADSPPSIHIGYAQILIAPRDFFKTSLDKKPLPTQKTVFRAAPDGQEKSAESLLRRPLSPQASVQTLRLVVPRNTSREQTLRATLPLQIAVDSLGNFDLWIRLTRARDDSETAWQRIGEIEVTAF